MPQQPNQILFNNGAGGKGHNDVFYGLCANNTWGSSSRSDSSVCWVGKHFGV